MQRTHRDLRIPEDQASVDAQWRAAALKHGFRSSITLPLTAEGKVFAVLTFYAEQPNAFDSEETAQLVALAEDLSYAVARLRQGPFMKM